MPYMNRVVLIRGEREMIDIRIASEDDIETLMNIRLEMLVVRVRGVVLC